MVCSVLLLDTDGVHVRLGAAPSLPDEYLARIDCQPMGPRVGLRGTVMQVGRPVIVTDIVSDPQWGVLRDAAVASGLRACWATPILSSHKKVLGSFAMYCGTPRRPSREDHAPVDHH
jgi:GAF domain-containing protein